MVGLTVFAVISIVNFMVITKGSGRMAEVSARTLPPGYAFEWTGTAYQEQRASGQTGIILALAVLFAFLFLVALYESWVIPIPVLLSVTAGVLGAFVGMLVGGRTLDLYGQIGLVVLIALALVNLLALHRARSWRAVADGGPVAARVRWAAGISALCWLGVLVAGRMIGFL